MKRFLSRPKGYTLIELTIACSLLVIIISFSVPNQTFFTKKLVQNETKTLCTTMRYLQQKAIASNTTQTLTCLPATHSYSYSQINRTVTYALPHSVRFGSITFAKHRILFHPNGIISSGTIHLVNRDKTVMWSLTSSVSQVSFLRLYRYNNHTKKRKLI